MVKRYRLIKNFNRKCDADVNVHVHVNVNGDDEVTTIALCTSCRRAKKGYTIGVYIYWNKNTNNFVGFAEDFVKQGLQHMSHVMRNQDFCLCENKGADQLRRNCTVDLCLCFCYTDSRILFLLISKSSGS